MTDDVSASPRESTPPAGTVRVADDMEAALNGLAEALASAPREPSAENSRPSGPHGLVDSPRLRSQLAFLELAAELQQVRRRTYVADSRGRLRRENAAEHSWHATLAVTLLAEHAAEPIDTDHAVRLLMIHDLVELEAGDTFVFDPQAQATVVEREHAASRSLAHKLPLDQGRWFLELFDEFVAQDTPESRFCKSVDRLLPQVLHHMHGGKTWREHGIDASQVQKVWAAVDRGSPSLGEVSRAIIDDAIDQGWIASEGTGDTPKPASPSEARDKPVRSGVC